LNAYSFSADSVSVACNGFSDSLSHDLINISSNHQLNTLAFSEIDADSFPQSLSFEISFQNLIVRASDIKHVSSNISNPFRKVKNESQTQVLTFISSDIREWVWSKEFDIFTNIKVIYVENCILPEVLNFRNW